MNSKKLFLTSSGLSADMKKKFFDIIEKCPEDVKVLNRWSERRLCSLFSGAFIYGYSV